jgi:hypothetical protein
VITSGILDIIFDGLYAASRCQGNLLSHCPHSSIKKKAMQMAMLSTYMPRLTKGTNGISADVAR